MLPRKREHHVSRSAFITGGRINRSVEPRSEGHARISTMVLASNFIHPAAEPTLFLDLTSFRSHLPVRRTRIKALRGDYQHPATFAHEKANRSDTADPRVVSCTTGLAIGKQSTPFRIAGFSRHKGTQPVFSRWKSTRGPAPFQVSTLRYTDGFINDPAQVRPANQTQEISNVAPLKCAP